MVETTDHADLRIGGSFGVRLMRAVAAWSVIVTRDGPEPDGKFPTHASCCSIVRRFSPDPRHQHTHKRTEAREYTEYEQHGPDTEDPSVKKTIWRDHDHTS